MSSVPMTAVQGKYGTTYVLPATIEKPQINLPADSGSTVLDSVIEIDGDFCAVCPECGTQHIDRKGELAVWHRVMDCLNLHRQHYARNAENIPFDGAPMPYDDSHETGGEQYGLRI